MSMREETIVTRDVEATAIPYGDKVPLDERVISPASIFNSPLLQEVP